MSEWSSHWVDLDGPTHYVDFGGPAGAPPLVAVHGLGGSHANWLAVGPMLATTHRVYAIDLAGHGLTQPDHRPTDVHANQRLLDRFLREVTGTPAILMGNSMGGMITILQASTHPDTVSAAVLIDPALPSPRSHRPDRQVALTFLGYAVPGVGSTMLSRRRRRLTAEQQVQQVLDLCCVDASRVPPEVVQRAVELVGHRSSFTGLERAFLDAARSLLLTLVRRRSYEERMRALDVPVLLLQGERDRLVSAAAARAAAARNPDWRLVIHPDLGHTPQLEGPEWTVEEIVSWAASVGAPAAG